jgi:hypothetical protein
VCTILADAKSYFLTIYHDSGNTSIVSRSTDEILHLETALSVAGEIVFVAGTSTRNKHDHDVAFVHTYGTVPLQLVRVWEDSIPILIGRPDPFLLNLGDMACYCFSEKQHINVNLISHEGKTTVCLWGKNNDEFSDHIIAFVSGARLFLLAQRGRKTRILELDKEKMVFRAYGALVALTQKSYITNCGLTGKELEGFWWYEHGRVYRTRIRLASKADNSA